MNTEINFNIPITIDGMGIIFCSSKISKKIKNGDDYFSKEYSTPKQVVKHILKGDIVGFCTGSGGNYILKFRNGYPDETLLNQYPIATRLAIVIEENTLQIRDLFELMDWNQECSPEKSICIENGIYHITLCTCKPETGIVGDNQEIYVFLNKLSKFPHLKYDGVPQLVP